MFFTVKKYSAIPVLLLHLSIWLSKTKQKYENIDYT